MNHQNDSGKIEKLLEEYSKKYSKECRPKGEILSFKIDGHFFDGEKEITIYNPTKPIQKDGKRFLLGRVELIDSENSKVMFFVEEDKKWKFFSHPVFDLQDPFYIDNIQGYQIIGGVRTYFNQDSPDLGYETIFYKYKNCATELIDNGELKEPFCVGPKKMKDIRLIELSNGKIGVFSRPQGGEAALGKIAYIEIDSLEQLSKKIIKAEIIPDLFNDSEWGGANELHLLKNGMIGVLGHIAHFEERLRHYYSMSFTFDPKTFKTSDMKILATAGEFPSIRAKKNYLGNIIFSGGIERSKDGKADLYVGIGDTKVGCIEIADPFIEIEQAVAQ